MLIRPCRTCETRFRAVFRSMLRLSGELSFLALDASSWKITSRRQWSWFSIDQCFLTESANSFMSVSDVIKHLVNWRVPSFSMTVDFTLPSPFKPLHSPASSNHEMSVRRRCSLFSILPCPFSCVVTDGSSGENAWKCSSQSLYKAGWFRFNPICVIRPRVFPFPRKSSLSGRKKVRTVLVFQRPSWKCRCPARHLEVQEISRGVPRDFYRIPPYRRSLLLHRSRYTAQW